MSANVVVPQFSFPNGLPGRWRIPADFELWPDVHGTEGAGSRATLPVTPPIPPTVQTGDVITSQHEKHDHDRAPESLD
jgi:hypothetical protein